VNRSAPLSVPPPKIDPCAITVDRLLSVAKLIPRDQAPAHARALEGARVLAQLNTTNRVRHFLAQCAHETAGFTRLTESLIYSDPVRLDALFSAVRDVHHARGLIAGGPQAVANCVYACRMGNGDARSFDGWNFRGRGYLQVTGRANYAMVAQRTGLPLLQHPEMLGYPEEAAQAAAAYWVERDVNAEADRDDVKGVTGRINPALVGLDDRMAWVGRFRAVYP
jgi:putative chitinase